MLDWAGLLPEHGFTMLGASVEFSNVLLVPHYY
jgi:hypothetical protein